MKYRIYDTIEKRYVDNERNFVLSQDGTIRALGGCTFMPERGLIPEFSTELKDSNGIEIYEGDVIEIHEYTNDYWQFFTEKEREVCTIDELKGKCRNHYVSVVIYNQCEFIVTDETDCETPIACFHGNMKNSCPIYEATIIGNKHAIR